VQMDSRARNLESSSGARQLALVSRTIKSALHRAKATEPPRKMWRQQPPLYKSLLGKGAEVARKQIEMLRGAANCALESGDTQIAGCRWRSDTVLLTLDTTLAWKCDARQR